MKKLLAIINEPKKAKPFINYIIQLAADLDNNAKFIHVLNPNDYLLGAPGDTSAAAMDVQHLMNELSASAKKELTDYIHQAEKESSGNVKIDFILETGIPSEIVKNIVNEGNVSFVAIEGEKDMDFWIQSSGNMDVIRVVNCPVWVIPYKSDYKPYQKIVYATDYKEEDISTLRKLIDVTKKYSPVITGLHITNDLNFDEKVKKAGFNEILQENLQYNNVSLRVMAGKDNEDLTKIINDFAWISKADLIVILKENKNFFERIFNPDQTKKILEHAALPVLIYHEKK